MKIKRFTSNVKKKSQTCTTAKESSVHHSKGGTWFFLQMTISTLVSVHGCKTHLKHMNPGKARKADEPLEERQYQSQLQLTAR